jgi:hypothetical protein
MIDIVLGSKIRIKFHQVQQCFSNKIKPLYVILYWVNFGGLERMNSIYIISYGEI